MHVSYRYRIYPDAAQQQRLDAWLKTCRKVYNRSLRELKDWIASRKCPIDRCSLVGEYVIGADCPFPSYHRQQNQLPQARKTNPQLRDVPAQMLQAAVRRLHDAWDWFRERGYGFPRFKKPGRFRSLVFPQFSRNPVTGEQIELPKLGRVPINLHRPLPKGSQVKQVRIIRKAKGWYASLSLAVPWDLPNPSPHGRWLGIDAGLECLVATSDGDTVAPPRFDKHLQGRLQVLQRRLAKKQLGSRNRKKAKHKVAQLHEHIAERRRDWHYKLAHWLCDRADSIAVENLDYRTTARGMLGKDMLDASHGEFRSVLAWVCRKRGKHFRRVDARSTSQTCPNCRATVAKSLAQRWHHCSECGHQAHRNVAAGQEIANRALEAVEGVSTQGHWGKEMACQVGLPGAKSLGQGRGAGMLSREAGKPAP